MLTLRIALVQRCHSLPPVSTTSFVSRSFIFLHLIRFIFLSAAYHLFIFSFQSGVATRRVLSLALFMFTSVDCVRHCAIQTVVWMHPDRQVRIGLRSVSPGELFNKLISRYPSIITSIGDQSMGMDMLHAISHVSHYRTDPDDLTFLRPSPCMSSRYSCGSSYPFPIS
jgi:hypothetical protein